MISQRGASRFRSVFFLWAFVLLFAGLLAGCPKTADLVGDWHDISVDGAGSSALSPSDRERMRHHLSLKADGSGTYTVGGTPSNAPKPFGPKEYPIHWSLSGKYMTITGDGDKSATFTVNDSHTAIGNDGTKSTFSGDVVSFVRTDSGAGGK